MTQPKRSVQFLAGICASLAFVFTGAALSWPSPALPKIKNGEAGISLNDAQISWMVSLVTLGALPGCYLGQRLSETLGRKLTIFASAVPGLMGSVMIMLASRPEILYAARVLEGISTGTIAVVTMIYITEIADKEIRGSLGMLVQVMNNLGSLLVYGVGPFVSYWTLNVIVASIPVLYCALCLWIPETPYYYLKKGKTSDAKKVFMKLKGSKDDKWADEQLAFLSQHVQENMENKSTVRALLTNERYRRAVKIIAGLKFLQYMTGALAIQSYLELIFRQGGGVSGPRASILYGFVQLAAGILATFLAGAVGRRPLMYISSAGVAVSLTIVGLYFYLQDNMKIDPHILGNMSFLPLVGILAFNVLYAIGIGNIPYVLQAELFPINVKSVASSVATMAACVFSFSVAKGYQSVKDLCGLATVFWLFAGVAYFGVWFIYYSVPETKGKTLEEVQEYLEMKTEEERRLRQ